MVSSPMVGLILKGQSRLCQFDTTGLPRGMPGHPAVSSDKGGISNRGEMGSERNSKYMDPK